MAKQTITITWAELIGVSETSLDKYIENNVANTVILVYVGATAPIDELEAATLRFTESILISADLTASKVWVKSQDEQTSTITII